MKNRFKRRPTPVNEDNFIIMALWMNIQQLYTINIKGFIYDDITNYARDMDRLVICIHTELSTLINGLEVQ